MFNECVNSESSVKITQRATLSQNAKLNSNANLTEMDNCNKKDRNLNSSRISRGYVRAKFEKNGNIQKIISLVKDRNKQKKFRVLSFT